MHPSRHGLGEAAITPAPPIYAEFGIYTYEVDLSADQVLTDQSISIDADSDFLWMKLAGSATGIYEIRFRLPSGRYMSSSRIHDANLIGTAQFPVPIFPHVRAPASGRIGVDILDLSSAANSVQIVLIGQRLFKA